MELLTTPRLSTKELQTLSESTLFICKNIDEVKTEYKQVNEKLANYIDGMTKMMTYGETKKEVDNARDNLVAGFVKDVLAEKHYPNTNATAADAFKKVSKIVDKYGSGIARLAYNKETAMVDNMLAELSQIDTMPLDPTGIMGWPSLIKKANDEFKQLANNITSEKAAEADSATKLAPELVTALNELYAMMFSCAKLVKSEPIKKAYSELETLIASY